MSPSWKALLCYALLGAANVVNAGVVQYRNREETANLDKRASGKVQVGYFTNWGIYGRNFQPDDMDTSVLTHVLYAFADTDPSSGAIKSSDTNADFDKHYADDSWNDTGNNVYGCIKRLFKLKLKQRNLKTLISVGGWTYSQAGHFGFVTNASARAKFISDAISWIENYGFDGIDIDFEYPSAAQKAGFTALITDLRTALDKLAASKGESSNPYLLSIAVSAGPDNYANLDVKPLNAALSLWNLMAYDYAGSWSTVSADQSNVYGGVTGFSTDSALSYFIGQGATASKIAFGIPIYGRAFEQTNGIYQPFNGIGPGTWEAGVYDYKALPLAGASVVENSTTLASYSYDASKKELVSYDTPGIVTKKVAYLNSKGLAGTMYWELSADKTGSASLLHTAASSLGALDSSQNHINYPNSVYDNIRNKLGSGGTVTTTSSGSTPTGGTGTGKCAGVPAWTAAAVFTGGQSATYNGHLWTAKWWTQGETPVVKADGVWVDNGAC
ncbi:hypothetical protein EXIGLDRAFT_743634 [Exidia glandulosa HHB12029]|uniref:chitinase n=1 Tax=Exidia glandulosa HHB12029 TaxID=1314781 RepID=A0A165QS55_EXIGL|nr:hypothetical protein EXIGLDRAFT_743634 [Exidia glandulosa HHB12029]